MWFGSEETLVSHVESYLDVFHFHWYEDLKVDGLLQPYVLTCPVPNSEVPMAVSLVGNECQQAQNCLKVSNKRPLPNEAKGKLAVCTKELEFAFADVSIRYTFHLFWKLLLLFIEKNLLLRLLEWIEMNFVLGVNKIILYEFQVGIGYYVLCSTYADNFATKSKY